MGDIEEFQQRINSALDRISQSMKAAAASATDSEELAAAHQAYEEERLANTQLEERVKTMRATRQRLEDEIEALREKNSEALSRLDSELQSLRRANQQLRDNNAALREANSEGVGEAHLINKSMMAELDSLRAMRAADQAETTAILSELTSVIESAAGATVLAHEVA
ncbi:MAG: hypothetical protein AAFR02_01115 [Pseudomonadota bacterium]